MSAPHTPAERFSRNVQRRSASVLKQRVLEQQQRDFAIAVRVAGESDALERAAAVIVSARRRFILATGKSFAYASLLRTDLSAGLARVALVDGASATPLDLLTDIRPGDALIAISLERYRRETVELARAYAQRGGTLVLLTDSAEAPLADAAHELLVVGSDSASYANSPTQVALALHLLATLAIASSKGAGRRLRERDSAADELGLYVRG